LTKYYRVEKDATRIGQRRKEELFKKMEEGGEDGSQLG
jgi:hypothetical protein